MWEAVKKYWDLIVGFIVGLGLSFMSHIDSEAVQRIYFVIVLILVCMAFFRTVRQAVERRRERKRREREHNLIDAVVDTLTPVKTIRMVEDPIKEGKKIEELFIKIGGNKHMKKFKEFFDKFKGIMLTIALGVLTIVEGCGGFINDMFGGTLTFYGVDVIPLVTLVASIVVGIISNGWTKEQKAQIKALFSGTNKNEIVIAGIKEKLKESKIKLKELNSALKIKETKLDTLNKELKSLKDSYSAKKEMYVMIPQLATEEEVQIASCNVTACEVDIEDLTQEIEALNAEIATLQTNINALKSQL